MMYAVVSDGRIVGVYDDEKAAERTKMNLLRQIESDLENDECVRLLRALRNTRIEYVGRNDK